MQTTFSEVLEAQQQQRQQPQASIESGTEGSSGSNCCERASYVGAGTRTALASRAPSTAFAESPWRPTTTVRGNFIESCSPYLNVFVQNPSCHASFLALNGRSMPYNPVSNHGMNVSGQDVNCEGPVSYICMYMCMYTYILDALPWKCLPACNSHSKLPQHFCLLAISCFMWF